MRRVYSGGEPRRPHNCSLARRYDVPEFSALARRKLKLALSLTGKDSEEKELIKQQLNMIDEKLDSVRGLGVTFFYHV